MKTTAIVRPAITAIDRKIATLSELRKVLITLGKFADSYQPTKIRRTLSKSARRKISVAQKARWRKLRKTNGKVLHMRKTA